jgi:hypothetical protein
MSKKRLRSVAELAAVIAAGVGYVANVAGWSEGNVLHAVSCRHCPDLDVAYGQKWWYARTEEAVRDLDERCGPGRWHECGDGCCAEER